MSGNGASDCACLGDILPKGTALSRPVYQTGLFAAGRGNIYVSDPEGTVKIIIISMVHQNFEYNKGWRAF